MKQKLVEWLNVIMGFRKFIAWFALFIIAIVFRIKAYIDGGQFVDLLKTTFTGLVAGNMTEHIVSFGKDYVASKNQAQAKVSDDDKDVTPVVEEN